MWKRDNFEIWTEFETMILEILTIRDHSKFFILFEILIFSLRKAQLQSDENEMFYQKLLSQKI